MADRYNIDNVPTALWIDENRTIVRPNDVVFGTNTFKFLTGIDSAEHIDALKSWVRGESEAESYLVDEQHRDELQSLPSENRMRARAEYHLAQWLYEQGQTDAARDHYERACDLAPDDVAINRGSMRMRGGNPMGWSYLKMVIKRFWKGLSYYNPLPTRLS